MKRRSTVIVRVPYTPVPRQYKSLEEVWNGADSRAEQSTAASASALPEKERSKVP